jgi:hypothetical protein
MSTAPLIGCTDAPGGGFIRPGPGYPRPYPGRPPTRPRHPWSHS